MRRKDIASAFTLLLLASVFAFGLTINKASAQSSTTLSIPSVTKAPSDLGNTFTVPVQISDVTDLFGFDINMTWDNTLITFSSLDSSSLSTVWPQGFFTPLPLPGYQTDVGTVRFAAVATGGSGFTSSGTTTLFTITFTVAKSGNFPYSTSIHFNSVKLSDHLGNPITVTTTDGPYSMSATVPDIDFTLIDPNPAKPWEYGKYFEVQVYASQITSTLTGYDLKVDYNSELLSFYGVHGWGALGTGSVDTSVSSVVHVSISGGTASTGNSILLFTLTFQVAFDNRAGHIWKKGSSNALNAAISLDTTDGDLSFTEGTLYVNGTGPTPVTPPSAISLTINLIQGDVNCVGQVDVFALRTVAAYYDKTSADPNWSTISKYDLNGDGSIDIYDLVLVAANFGYYKPDSPP
jgi:hypothetical protein